MDLCIKTETERNTVSSCYCFNPCFNGSMYKNCVCVRDKKLVKDSFNPCFNGSMYKNS